MRSKRFYITLVVMVMIGLGIFYVIQAGFYPVAFVNSSTVSARSFNEAMASANHYYDKALRTYSSPDTASAEKQVLRELRRATLDKMIENILVRNELEERIGQELSGIVEKKLDIGQLKTADFEKAVGTLYGLTLDKFKELVLVPQAREEVLHDKIKENKQDFKEWLARERRAASVVILAPGLYWNGERIALK